MEVSMWKSKTDTQRIEDDFKLLGMFLIPME